MKTPCSNHGAQGGRHPRLRSPCHQVSFHFSSSSGVLKPFLTTVWLTHTWDHLSGEVTPRQPFRGCRMSPWGPLLRVPAAQPPSLAGGADAFAAPASALIDLGSSRKSPQVGWMGEARCPRPGAGSPVRPGGQAACRGRATHGPTWPCSGACQGWLRSGGGNDTNENGFWHRGQEHRPPRFKSQLHNLYHV